MACDLNNALRSAQKSNHTRRLNGRNIGALLLAGAAMCLSGFEAAAQNLIQNPGFEVNPPSNFGNNVGHSIAPWVIGDGQQPNVVQVDGAGGQSFSAGTFGPEFDAQNGGTGAGAGYL